MTVMQNQRLHHSFNSFSKIAEEKKKAAQNSYFFNFLTKTHSTH